MGLFDLAGKAPKLEDAVAAIDELDGRIINLEQYVARNEARISALEKRYDQVIVVAGERIGQLEATVQGQKRVARQLRWVAKTRRGRRTQQ